jgi:hypothetical protein
MANNKLSLAGLFLLAGLIPAAPGVAAGDGLEPGRRFPDLVLPSLEDGKPSSISDFRGHKLVLHVFASW